MCAEQGITLRDLTKQHSSNDLGKTPDTEKAMQRGNFLTIINAFATWDAVLVEHLEKVKHFMKRFIKKV